VQVFGASGAQPESDAAKTRDPKDMPEAAYVDHHDAHA